MSHFTYRRGAERPSITLPWKEQTAANTWVDLNLSTGYEFSLTLEYFDTVTVTKTTGITGADGSVVIDWEAGELDIARGDYQLHLRATTGGVDRDYSPDSPVTVTIV